MDIAAALSVKTPQRPDALRAPQASFDQDHGDFETELTKEASEHEQSAKARPDAPEPKGEPSDTPEDRKAETAPPQDAVTIVVPGVAAAEAQPVAQTPQGQTIPVKTEAGQPALGSAGATIQTQIAAQQSQALAAAASDGQPAPETKPIAPVVKTATDGQSAVPQNTQTQTQQQNAAALAEAIVAPKPATTPHKKQTTSQADTIASAAQSLSSAAPAPAQAQATVTAPPAQGQGGAAQNNADQGQSQGAAAIAPAHAQTHTPHGQEFKLDASATAAVQQPALAPAQNASPTAPALVAQNAPVFIPPEALGVAIARKAMEGMNKFELRLDPPEMGRLDVSLEVDDAGNIRAHIRAERPEALELLQREAKGMEQALRQAGLNLDQSSLSFSLSSREGRDAQDQAHHGRRAKFNAVLPEDEIHAAAIRGSTSPASGVDLRV